MKFSSKRRSPMRVKGIVLVFGLVVACGQDYNSNSGDAMYGKAVATVAGSALFQRSFAILQRECTGCHRGTHAAWGAFRTEEDWIRAGLVVPGDRASSPLITDLLNEGGDMPLGGRALPESDYQTLVQWIEELP